MKISMGKSSCGTGIGAILLVAVLCSLVYAESPALEQLKTRIASLQQVLRDPNLTGAEHLNQRRRLA